MAGITRGSIIIGNASGNPAALAIGTNDYVLTSDGTDIAWEAASGGGGSSEWTDTGSVLHPTDISGTADAVVIGGTTTGNSDIAFNTDGSAVFNEQSASVDFRVESNGNANMLFVDGSADAVGIGTSAPVAALTVGGEVSASNGFRSAVMPITTLTSNGVVTYDIAGPALQTIILKANQANTYLGTESLPIGKTVTVRLSANGANRTLGWHTSMNFVGEKPASIARDKIALLSITTFGTLCGVDGVDTDVVCAYAVED
jgi:prepilin-type processing-associated H-X9-DG protein